jgi:hypothetical protein
VASYHGMAQIAPNQSEVANLGRGVHSSRLAICLKDLNIGQDDKPIRDRLPKLSTFSGEKKEKNE